eukprot:910665-Rhodomonas_salina.1
MSLCACYTMSGTDQAWDYQLAALREWILAQVRSPMPLCACYAMSGTDLAYCGARISERGSLGLRRRNRRRRRRRRVGWRRRRAKRGGLKEAELG